MKEYLKLYEGDLIGKDLVRLNQVPYMVWWVKHFLSVGQPEEAMYADILEKEGRNELERNITWSDRLILRA